MDINLNICLWVSQPYIRMTMPVYCRDASLVSPLEEQYGSLAAPLGGNITSSADPLRASVAGNGSAGSLVNDMMI